MRKVTLAGSNWVHWVLMLVLKISVCLISPCIYFFLSLRSCRGPFVQIAHGAETQKENLLTGLCLGFAD